MIFQPLTANFHWQLPGARSMAMLTMWCRRSKNEIFKMREWVNDKREDCDVHRYSVDQGTAHFLGILKRDIHISNGPTWDMVEQKKGKF